MKLKEFVPDNMFKHIINLCKKELELDEIPNIEFVDDDTIPGQNSFGQFNNDTIKVVVKNRHPIDVARTISHELVHWKQKIENLTLDGSDGSETENQANAVAGIIMRKFGNKYPEYFINSLPK